jgi:hypothetical protein
MNPYKLTREEFTESILSRPVPNEASDFWKDHAVPLRELYSTLACHPAMVDTGTMQQTYETPAISKNKIYCQ